MERLNPQVSMAYWKVSSVVLVVLMLTSYISCRCFESQRLPRSHVLKISELLRKAAEHSIRASQDNQPVTVYTDTCQAKTYVDLVEDLLTAEQVRSIASVNVLEMKEFIARQHEDASERLYRICVENRVGSRVPQGGFNAKI
jgi:hypothetical protein